MARTSTASSDTIISALATIHLESNEMEPKMWMDRVKQVCISSWDDSIMSVLQRYHAFSSQEVGMVFMKMLSYVELAVKCQSLLHSSTDVSSLRDIYATFIAPLPDDKATLHTFVFWNALGHKFGQLAAGGSIYVLLMVAGLDLYWSIARALGKLVHSRIIPIIAFMREKLPLSFENHFCIDFNILHGLSATVDCMSLKDSDRFFDCLERKFPSRSCSSWKPCLTPVLDDLLPVFNIVATADSWNLNVNSSKYNASDGQGLFTDIDIEIAVVAMQFDPSLLENQRFTAEHDRTLNKAWNKKERELAETRVDVSDLSALQSKLDMFYPGGHKLGDSYVQTSMDIIPGALQLCNADGSLMAFVCNTMLDAMRETLYDRLKASFDNLDIFQSRLPSSTHERDDRFETVHFSWWNCYGVSGEAAPEDVHPHFLGARAAKGCREFNFTQMLPYLSQEMFNHEQLYLNIQASLADVFEWIKTVFRACLPKEYKALVELVELLPGKPDSPVAPFLSLVININVATLAHRDAKDKLLCLVLAVGHFTGGGIVLKEQGLVVELRHSDFIAFTSADTTHFNLEYVGERASLVVHIDGGFDKWKEGHNGWEDHSFFH
ncbi:hypothetical protein BDR03DRAFT_1012081 [Suillus americanus]|nr:hypothetical protein BDR03DRAFT_1012081 [Suillus americanus]